jgi:hypothetical protein
VAAHSLTSTQLEASLASEAELRDRLQHVQASNDAATSELQQRLDASRAGHDSHLLQSVRP